MSFWDLFRKEKKGAPQDGTAGYVPIMGNGSESNDSVESGGGMDSGTATSTDSGGGGGGGDGGGV